jgi:hypothetical protein
VRDARCQPARASLSCCQHASSVFASAGLTVWDPALTIDNPKSDAGCQAGIGGTVPLVYNTSAKACVLPTSTGPSCVSFVVRSPTLFKHVRGRVLGVQTGELCAFGPVGRSNSSVTLDSKHACCMHGRSACIRAVSVV